MQCNKKTNKKGHGFLKKILERSDFLPNHLIIFCLSFIEQKLLSKKSLCKQLTCKEQDQVALSQAYAS